MEDNATFGHLTKELMETQIGQVDLLMAMYEPDNAIALEGPSSVLLKRLRSWCDRDNDDLPQLTESCITMLLTLEISGVGDETKPLQVNLSVPVIGDQTAAEPPSIKTRLRQPEWMNKSDVARLSAGVPDEDILTVIEHIKAAATQRLRSQKDNTETSETSINTTPLVRAWFYFPSISTREKREDLVNHSQTYGLTGFLLAGKPGILCLEGQSSSIDDFMKFIKTESWGDIPPQHKKVSERFRERDTGLKRVFTDMREITDSVGERRGERANRNDMRAVRAWLDERGLGEAFEKVLL